MNRSLNWMSWGFQVWLPLVSCPAGLLCRCTAATERTPGWPRVSNAHERFVSWATWLRRGPRLQSDASTAMDCSRKCCCSGCVARFPRMRTAAARVLAPPWMPDVTHRMLSVRPSWTRWTGWCEWGESRVRAVGVRVGRGDREGRRGASAAALFICMSSVPLI